MASGTLLKSIFIIFFSEYVAWINGDKGQTWYEAFRICESQGKTLPRIMSFGWHFRPEELNISDPWVSFWIGELYDPIINDNNSQNITRESGTADFTTWSEAFEDCEDKNMMLPSPVNKGLLEAVRVHDRTLWTDVVRRVNIAPNRRTCYQNI
ncbi:hypothetical protein CHS0354_032660 [Potamilus streckersoni]|uniref:C-type lectin domain-containing protein n=1 Tax=Potamilus streckersoni TaxID=2493646 RepID=A0AAE0TJ71_9BIVA|nr:hypothetical protein CHS0354_032660 [Potamilus streckersoni]